jgi:hypothetical protein
MISSIRRVALPDMFAVFMLELLSKLGYGLKTCSLFLFVFHTYIKCCHWTPQDKGQLWIFTAQVGLSLFLRVRSKPLKCKL